MRPIRNTASIAMQEQPGNPLDDYLALLHAEDARLRQPQCGKDKALVLPVYTSAGGIAGDPRNQFELNHVQFENRSSSWVEMDRDDRRLPKGPDYGSQTGRGLIAQLSRELTEAKLILSDSCTQTAFINDAGSGGIGIPGSTKEVRCDIDQPIPKIKAPVRSTANRVTSVPPQKPSRTDGGGPFQGPADENPPLQRPVGTNPASTGLHDEIETWVNEGGAGDDVA